ncbi:hypothetical protein M0802_002552 [Mischocyttarus mexicanus]|nr:hypothetical protein M0802_002552 [Mischocyttarus mexicanus]
MLKLTWDKEPMLFKAQLYALTGVHPGRQKENINESELVIVLDLLAGLTNLGNTYYLNATVQYFKIVLELREALKNASESWTELIRMLQQKLPAKVNPNTVENDLQAYKPRSLIENTLEEHLTQN